MSLEQELFDRSHSQCELCSANQNLSAYIIPPKVAENVDHAVLVCVTCLNQIEDPDLMDLNHWRCLNDSIWNQNPAVQVVSWRMLNRIKDHGWPKDLMEMMYMEAETLAWARAEDDLINPEIVHKDVNGAVLQSGDSVVLIKDLKVKGSSLVAKQGTAVRRISLDPENSEYIEGKVAGQHIVILTKFVKKT